MYKANMNFLMKNSNAIKKVFNNSDILNIIIKNLKNISFEDLIKFREINKAFYNTFENIFKKKYNSDKLISGQSTFICVAFCWFCNTNKNLESFRYLFDNYPCRIISTCNNFICKLKTYQSFLYDSYEYEKKIILFKDLELPDMYIPRSDGSKTLASPQKKFFIVIDDKLFLNFTFNDFQKNCDFQEVIKLNKDDKKIEKFLFNFENKGMNYLPYYDIDMRNKFDALAQKLFV